MEFRLVAAGKLKTVLKADASSEIAVFPTDAFFTSSAGLGAVGIASGCTQPQPEPQDSAYAPALISNCASAFTTATSHQPTHPSAKPRVIDPAYILAHAQQATRHPGTAAVSLTALQPDGKLCVTNLGNCKVLLLRDGAVWDETDEQLHAESFGGVKKPYQIGHPSYAKDADSIHDAERYLWSVQEGDIVVSGTDAFFSHIKRQEILSIISQVLANCKQSPNPSPRSGLKRVASAIRRHTSGGGALRPDSAQSESSAAAAASAESNPSSSRGPSPELKGADLATAAAQASDMLATVAAKRLAKRKAKAAAAAEAAAAAATSKGSILARLKPAPKPQRKQAGTAKDNVACVVAVISAKALHLDTQDCSSCSSAVTAAGAAAASDIEVIPAAAEVASNSSAASDTTDYQSSQSFDSPSSASTSSDPAAMEEPSIDSKIITLETLSISSKASSPAAASLSPSGSSADLSNSSLSRYRTPSEPGSTSMLLRAASLKDPRPAKSASRPEIGPEISARIKFCQAGTDLAHSHAGLIPAGWTGPELGESPTKLKSESRRSGSAKLLSSAAESPAGGYSSRPLHRMTSMQSSYYSTSRRSSNAGYPPEYQQSRSRRATGGGSGSNYRSDGGATDYVGSRVQGYKSSRRTSSSSNLTALAGLPPTPASAISKSTSSTASPPLPPATPSASSDIVAIVPAVIDPTTAVPAGMDSQGKQLYVGCRVLVTTEAGVAAVGTVKLVTGQQLNKWEPEKVCPGHVGIGDMRIDSSMESAARQTRFWVKCEAFKLYGNHPDYTFWTKKATLEKAINISIPCSSLKLVDLLHTE